MGDTKTTDKEEVKSDVVEQNGAAQSETKALTDVKTGNDDGEPNLLEKQILRQVEYYFGDINLPRDKFLLEQIKLDDGWIPMSIMLKFQRLTKLTTDPKVIAGALRHSELMEIDDSGEEIKIRRLPDHPLPEVNDERKRELQERTVYCKGFPLDSHMDPIIEFFSKYGAVDNIIMRKYKDKLSKAYKFKGSVFVTFTNKEKAQEFLSLESVKHGDTELIKKWQLEYIEDKKKELLENKMKRIKKSGGKETLDAKESFPKGAIIHLKGTSDSITREDIKMKFTELGFETAFISFCKGDKEAYVRLQEENSGKAVLNKTGKEISIMDCKVEARLLEGEEEEKFLEQARIDRSARLKKCHQSRQGGRKGKRAKGNKNSRKRKGDVEDSPPAKKMLQAETD